jgi:hypothetical protein
MADNLPIEIDYNQVMQQVTRFYGSDTDPWREIMFRSDSANPTRLAEEYLQSAGIKVIRASNGRVVTYARSTALDSYSDSPISTPNSNQQTATYGGNARTVEINGSATQTTEGGVTTTTLTKGAKSVSTGRTIATTAGNVLFGVGMVSFAGHLGKTISDIFYDGTQWEMTPSEWSDLYNESDGLGKFLLTALYGVDGQNATMYMDEQALAQAYMTLRAMGVFDNTYEVIGKTVNVDDTITSNDIVYGSYDSIALAAGLSPSELAYIHTYQQSSIGTYGFLYIDNGETYVFGTDDITPILNANSRVTEVFSIGCAFTPAIRQGFKGFGWRHGDGATPAVISIFNPINITGLVNPDATAGASLVLGTLKASSAVEGIEDDDQATTYIDPSLIDGQDRDTVLNQLQTNYPELFDGAIYQDVPQDDGTLQRQRFVPVPYVTPSNRPVTGNNHQNNPQVNPQTNTDTQLDDLIKTITKLLNPTDVPDTGEGDTPPTVIPTGSASSLWAVYNPTQAQVDAFGSWLWSSNFVDQLKKLFSDPMQAIIGIHKVFATPATGETRTIVCGYIDSEVPSKIVTSQYTTIDCGTVNLREYFGNVFDYSPFTEVSLYLPFIGIVRLDVSDVMRASITVKYHVDVITGACLADVIVNRDAAGGVLYQYSGSAIVTYPISSGSYASAMAGVLSIAGGIVGTIASGGAVAPALLGAAVGASHLHTDVQKSGSFSGAAGAMGGKIPYLIISRPQTAMPSSFKHLEGYPANHYTKLGDASGYVKVRAVQVKGINATDTELDMIDAALRQGVEL